MRFAEGVQFAGYTFERRLGRGGMATVYLVREPRLNRLVALKVLPDQLADDPNFAARFEQEAQVIAGLDHPNIIPVYRFGIDDGVPWMALRYVDGGDLADRLTARPLATSEGLNIFRGVAAALDYAHRKGVIHRDLKPQNILLTSDGAPYLADFGVAKLLEGSSKLKTATGSIFGTPAYMAPEQAMANPLGPYTDVYALAVICFQWLTGKLPFDADTPHAVLLKHVQEPLPQTAMGMLPVGVASVIDRGLAKDPQQRFQSAGGFVAELESALRLVNIAPAIKANTAATLQPLPPASRAHSPAMAPEPALMGGMPKPPSTWKAIGGTSLAFIIGIAGFAFWQARSVAPDTPRPHDIATTAQPPQAPATANATTESPAQQTAAAPLAPEPLKPAVAAPQPAQHAPVALVKGTLLVETTADCRLSVDSSNKGVLRTAVSQRVDLDPGEHRVQCVSTERKTVTLSQTKSVTVGQQAVVTFDIQSKVAELKKTEEDEQTRGRARAEAQNAPARPADSSKAADADAEAAKNGGFIDTANESLLDTRTGLEWMEGGSASELSYDDANKYCAERGWRLPDLYELEALYDSRFKLGCGGFVCHISPLFRLSTWVYWSSTKTPETQNEAAQPWLFGFQQGNRLHYGSTYPSFGRAICVRHP